MAGHYEEKVLRLVPPISSHALSYLTDFNPIKAVVKDPEEHVLLVNSTLDVRIGCSPKKKPKFLQKPKSPPVVYSDEVFKPPFPFDDSSSSSTTILENKNPSFRRTKRISVKYSIRKSPVNNPNRSKEELRRKTSTLLQHTPSVSNDVIQRKLAAANPRWRTNSVEFLSPNINFCTTRIIQFSGKDSSSAPLTSTSSPGPDFIPPELTHIILEYIPVTVSEPSPMTSKPKGTMYSSKSPPVCQDLDENVNVTDVDSAKESMRPSAEILSEKSNSFEILFSSNKSDVVSGGTSKHPSLSGAISNATGYSDEPPDEEDDSEFEDGDEVESEVLNAPEGFDENTPEVSTNPQKKSLITWLQTITSKISIPKILEGKIVETDSNLIICPPSDYRGSQNPILNFLSKSRSSLMEFFPSVRISAAVSPESTPLVLEGAGFDDDDGIPMKTGDDTSSNYDEDNYQENPEGDDEDEDLRCQTPKSEPPSCEILFPKTLEDIRQFPAPSEESSGTTLRTQKRLSLKSLNPLKWMQGVKVNWTKLKIWIKSRNPLAKAVENENGELTRATPRTTTKPPVKYILERTEFIDHVPITGSRKRLAIPRHMFFLDGGVKNMQFQEFKFMESKQGLVKFVKKPYSFVLVNPSLSRPRRKNEARESLPRKIRIRTRNS